MSRLRSNTNNHTCECKSQESTGVFSLRVEPRTVDVRETPQHDEVAQLQHSERIQELFFPHMSSVRVHQHGDGFHVHPEVPSRVAHINQLHDMLDENGLVARVQITPSAEDTAVSASLAREHVNDLLRDGTVDLKVPLHDGVFRLHSTRNGRITAAEYVV